MPLLPGQILNNRYRVVNLLGQGGFGAVYRAWDLTFGIPCAVKENTETGPDAQRQFEREARMLRILRHPNLPKVTDYFTMPGQGQYLVMDFIEGEDLQTRLDAVGFAGLPESQVLPWIIQVCEALDYLHSQNPPVIHRDIKPANIKITPDGQVVLVDFGIAKEYNPLTSTTRGARAVTPGYSPIEQYGQGKTDPRTDVYALGATLYALLTGQAPVESVQRTLSDTLVPPRQLKPALRPQTAEALWRALQMNPDLRFQSAAEFAAALRSAPPQPLPQAVSAPQVQVGVAASQATIAAQLAVPARRRQFPSLWIVLAALLMGVVYLLIAHANDIWPFVAEAPTPLPTIAPAVLPTETWDVVTAVAPTVQVVMETQAAGRATQLPRTPAFTVQPVSPSVPSADAQLGDTWARPTDKMLMIFIPAGEFLMGSADSDSAASSDEKPQHAVTLDPYWIDQTEVTNAMFERFVQQTGYQTTAEISGSSYIFNPSTRQFEFIQGADWRHPRGPESSLNGLADHPVVQVSWYDAVAYCSWAGSRLPTEAEWEKAARGTDGRIFPWGDRAVAGNLVNFADLNFDVDWADQSVDDGYQFTAPVGSYPAGASPYGALDMAGNVWEWVADWFHSDYYASSPALNPSGPPSGQDRALHGGSWYIGWINVRAADRLNLVPHNRSGDIGFRCAVSSG